MKLKTLYEKLLADPAFCFNETYSSKKTNAIVIALDYNNDTRSSSHPMQIVITVAWLYTRDCRPFGTIALRVDGYVREFIPVKADYQAIGTARHFFNAFRNKQRAP